MNSDLPLHKLSSFPLFQTFEKEDLIKLLEPLHWNLRSYPEGKHLAFRGAKLENLQFLVEGRLSAEISSMKGKTLKVEVLEAPALIAGPLLFAKENYLPVDLRSESPVEILSLNRDQALALLRSDGAILQQFIEDCADKISFLSDKIRLFQLSSLRGKIALYMLDQRVKQKNDRIRLPLKMEVLAELFSVARPSLSRSFSELVDEGYLERIGKDFLIPDPEILKELIED